MSKVEELNKLALKLTGENPYKKTIKESLESIASYLAGENIEVENIEDAIQKCTEYYSGGGGGGGSHDWEAIGFEGEPKVIQDGYDYAVEIAENWDSSITTMYAKYKDDVHLVYFPSVDTSNVTTMQTAFSGCSSLSQVALIDTSNVTSMGGMFSYCYGLSTVPKFDMGKVTVVAEMFSNCRSITKIDLDFSYAFSKTSMTGSMFSSCVGLKTIKFGNIDNISRDSNLGTYSNMFYGCDNLDDETLNDILKLLPKLRPTSTSTLKLFGISSAQATRCQSLSNYAAFTAAGWTTGY